MFSSLLQPATLVTLLASRVLGHYVRQHFLDKTFLGLYSINGFDLALLIPYFVVLVILAAVLGVIFGVSQLAP